MPTLIRPPQRQPTGIRLIDDLIGADATEAPPTERQPTTIRNPTTYENYVQPAILALRKLTRPLVKSMQDDPMGGLSPSPLASVVTKAAQPGVRAAIGGLKQLVTGGADDAAASVPRMLRESHNLDLLENYRRAGFDDNAMQAVEAFAQRNPRVFNRVSIEPLPADQTKQLGDFAAYLYDGAPGKEVGRVRLAQGQSLEGAKQTLDHEVRHAIDAKRMGGQAFNQQVKTELPLPRSGMALETNARGTQFARAAVRHEESKLGRALTGRERAAIVQREIQRVGPTLATGTQGLPQPEHLWWDVMETLVNTRGSR